MTAAEDGVLRRMTRAICPRAERRWIDAMFAELDAIDPAQRGRWMLGAPAIVAAVVRRRLALVPAAMIWGTLLSALAAVVFAIGSQSDFEGLRMDDDVFYRFAWISGVMFVGLGVLAINWIFNHSDGAPHHRR